MKIELTFFPIDVEFIKKFMHTFSNNDTRLVLLDANGQMFVPTIWNKTHPEIEKFLKEEKYTHFAFASVHQQMLIDKYIPKPKPKPTMPPKKEKK